MTTTEQPQLWNTMPTPTLLEHADALAERQPDSEVARCIYALTWRLKGAEEWIESQARRLERLA
jgi:hypothetical protein